MQSKIFNNVHTIKIVKGESITKTIHDYVLSHQIGFGKIEAIGMIEKATFGFLEHDQYVWRTWNESVELTSLNGNISWDKDNIDIPLIHLHGTITDENYTAFGGHFKDAIVSGVVELFITELSKEKVFKKHFHDVSFKTLDLE